MPPLLFNILIESLAKLIQANLNIYGIPLPPTEMNISFYANVAVVFLRDPVYSLPILFGLLEGYTNVSGYKVNQEKASFMDIHLNSEVKHLLRQI